MAASARASAPRLGARASRPSPACPLSTLRPAAARPALALRAALASPSQKAGRGGAVASARAAPVPSGRRAVTCAAAAKAGEITDSNPLVLGGLFAGWYAFNIYFNIFNKQVLKAFPHPLTCTWLQFGVGSLLALSMWAVKAHPRPNLNEDTLKSILPLASVHTLGNLLTNVSLGAVAVSFTHTIKAMEPFFSVLLSSIFLNEKPTPAVLLSMLPIVGGVALASATEMSFNWAGFTAAMGSNLTFQSRNVLSKKFMGKGKGSLDNINLFSTITILAFCLMTPVVLLTDGFLLTPAALKASGVGEAIIRQALAAAVCFHAYQQVSYMILARVSPVSHSIGNCLKRVIVIVASVLFFRNPMGIQNMVGTAIALAGVFAYSQVKRGQNAAAAKVA